MSHREHCTHFVIMFKSDGEVATAGPLIDSRRLVQEDCPCPRVIIPLT
jgi:hypothetical protein